MTIRRFLGSPLDQGRNEAIPYWFKSTPWGSAPTNVQVSVYVGATNVTGDVTAGSVSVDGDVVTLPLLVGLEVGVTYRVEVKFEAGGTTFDPYFELKGEL